MSPDKPARRIRTLLDEAASLEPGVELRRLLDEALALSQELGDETWEYEVRLALVECADFTGDTDAELSNFAWCLAKHDADPKRFPRRQRYGHGDILWQFKWIVELLDGSSIFSLAQCEAMLDDLEAHYRAANLGLSAVVLSRFRHAWCCGDLEQAKTYRRQFLITPRDTYSDCEACTVSTLARFATEIGEQDQALKLVDEIYARELHCELEPELALSGTLLATLRAGRLPQARSAHMGAYRLCRHNPIYLSAIGFHLQFCAITGNEARGLAMLERHLPWLAHDALDESGQLDLLAAIGTVLEAVAEVGYADQRVRGADAPALIRFFGPHDGPWTVQELALAAWQGADRLATAFDQRNHNTFRSENLAKARAIRAEHYELPILTDVFVPTTATPTPPTTATSWLERAEVFYHGEAYLAAQEAALKALDCEDAETRVEGLGFLIHSLVRLGRTEQAKAWVPLWSAALTVTGRLEAAQSGRLIGAAGFLTNPEADQPHLAAELERLEPGPTRAAIAVTLAAALAHATTKPEDWPPIMALLEQAVTEAEARESTLATTLRALAQSRMMLARYREAIELCDRALKLKMGDGERALTLEVRGRALGGLGRWLEGARDSDEAMNIFSRYDAPVGVLGCARLSSYLYREAEHYVEEFRRLRTAQLAAEQAEISTVRIRYHMGVALLNGGHPEEAVEYLWGVLGELEAQSCPDERLAEVCEQLALGFELAEIWGGAVGMYARAAALWAATNPVASADLLHRQAGVLRFLDHTQEARASLIQALELLGNQDTGVEIVLLESLALVKADLGDPSALGDIDKARQLAESLNEPTTWQLAGLMESRGLVLVHEERWEEAVAVFLQAAQQYITAGDLGQAAKAEHFAAQMLVDPLEDREQAIQLWRQAFTHAETSLAGGAPAQDLRTSILVKLSETLDDLGRTSEAADLRGLLAP
ncbi:MAG: hypothetical protein LBE83_08825 [Propionibacteriaceae bacterium]|nr:hypothetical protein [Propionibacteriaceae bacterium]